MVELAQILKPEHVILDLEAKSKRGVLHDLACHLGATEEEVRSIYDALMERERLGSTGVGRGVAIPHAVIPGLPGLKALFARLSSPCDFEAVDDRPVDLIFLLLAPESDGSEHLKALARIARLLHNPEAGEQLRRLKDPDAVWRSLTARQPSSHAA